MLFEEVRRRMVGIVTLSVAIIGGSLAGAVAASFHPTAAAALAVVASIVTCATTATACVGGANKSLGSGVSAASAKGIGLTGSGVSGVVGTGTSGVGVAGSSSSSFGVKGVSTTSSGLYGSTTSSSTAALYGQNTSTASGSAVYGGVLGTASGAHAYGVEGLSKIGIGVIGNSTSNDGVYGSTVTGQAAVIGTISGNAKGVGVYGNNSSSSSGIAPVGVLGTSNGSNGIGVLGSGGLGVVSETGSGEALYAAAESSGTGIGAYTNGGDGIDVSTTGGVGINVSTTNSGDGIDVLTSGGYGINVLTNGLYSVYANNSNTSSGSGGYFAGPITGALAIGGSTGLVAQDTNSGGFPVIFDNSAGNGVFYVDDNGNVFAAGNYNTYTNSIRGGSMSTFTPKTAAPSMEDTGTAQLVGGVADVRLDPTFAQTIDQSTAYRVFLTPNGDTRGLFVQSKSLRSFSVRESQGGHSTVTFDYRIVATPLGQIGRRMSTAIAPKFHVPSALRRAPRTVHRPAMPPIPKLSELR